MIKIAAFYYFTPITNASSVAKAWQEACQSLAIRGTMLVADEGVNATLAGTANAIRQILATIKETLAIKAEDKFIVKYADAPSQPFKRLKVKHKPEIITMGIPTIHLTPKPNSPITALTPVGRYVAPQEWNALINDPNVVVIDARNDYEVAIGSFKGAVNPNTQHFSQFPLWLQNWQKQNAPSKNTAKNNGEGKPKIAMFCTGGIRCEKATAYAHSLGFDEVYHLEGGILRYLEEMPQHDSLWQGACFVFDERVAVGHGLEASDYQLCRACRQAISAKDRTSPKYVAGISCPHCATTTSAADKARFAERQKQIGLAEARGEAHIGATRTTSKKSVKRCAKK